MKIGIQAIVAFVVVLVLLTKSWMQPGWVSAVELIAGLGLLAGRWFFEPKPKPPANKDDIQEMRDAIVNLGGQLKAVNDKVGGFALKLGFRT